MTVSHGSGVGGVGAAFFPLLVGALVLGVGCHGGTKGQTLEERVRAYWSARVAGDGVKAYEFEDLAVRGDMSLNEYVRAQSPMLRYQAYDLKSIEKKGGTAKVKVSVRYEFNYPTFPSLPLSMVLTDTWQLYEGVWYRRFNSEGPGAPKHVR